MKNLTYYRRTCSVSKQLLLTYLVVSALICNVSAFQLMNHLRMTAGLNGKQLFSTSQLVGSGATIEIDSHDNVDVLSVRSGSFASSARRPVDNQLFLGNIPYELDEANLVKAVTERLGNIHFQNIRLQRNKYDNASKGCAFIDFEDKSAAAAALSALSDLSIANRKIRVSVVVPKSQLIEGREPQNNVCYIANFDPQVTEDDVRSLFHDLLGDTAITRVSLLQDKDTGKSRGAGFVEFAKPEDAKRAILMVDGADLLGKDIIVSYAKSQKITGGTTEHTQSYGSHLATSTKPNLRPFKNALSQFKRPQHSVYLGNLAWSVDEGLLRELLDDVVGVGSYTNVRMGRAKDDYRFLGYAHVDFVNSDYAQKAIKELSDLEVCGRPIRCDIAATFRNGSPPSLNDESVGHHSSFTFEVPITLLHLDQPHEVDNSNSECADRISLWPPGISLRDIITNSNLDPDLKVTVLPQGTALPDNLEVVHDQGDHYLLKGRGDMEVTHTHGMAGAADVLNSSVQSAIRQFLSSMESFPVQNYFERYPSSQ